MAMPPETPIPWMVKDMGNTLLAMVQPCRAQPRR